MIPLLVTASFTLALAQAQVDERQAALGAQMAKEFRRRIKPLDSPLVSDFLDNLAHKLSNRLSVEGMSYEINLIADDNGDPRHEPYVLPGGYIFVPAKLITASRNEAEVARVLARSMALRFPRLSSAQTSGDGTIPVIFLGYGWAYPRTSLVPEAYRAQQQASEREADRDALNAVAAAGYDVSANQPPSAAFTTLQRELERLLPVPKVPERKPPTLFR